MKKARLLAKIVMRTRHQTIPNVTLRATFAVRARQHSKEACLVRNVWLGNTKKPQAQAQSDVPVVHRAITRTCLTCYRAISAPVVMPNHRRNKRRVFLVHRENLPAKKPVPNAMHVQLGIYNRNRNNPNVLQSNLDQSWRKEDLPRSSYRSGPKLMPMLHLGSQHVQREQKAAQHPMNRVKIVLLEHPAHPVPHRAKPATKESLMKKVVVRVAIA